MANILNDVVVIGVGLLGAMTQGVDKLNPKTFKSKAPINKNTLNFPVFVSNDLTDRNTVVEFAQAIQLKTAFDIKTAFESVIQYNAVSGMKLENAMKTAGLKPVDKDALIDLIDYVTIRPSDNINSVDVNGGFTNFFGEEMFLENISVDTMDEANNGVELLDGRNAYPTFITITLKVLFGNKLERLDYTLAVKCTPKYVSTEKLKTLMLSKKALDKEVAHGSSIEMLSWHNIATMFKSLGHKKKQPKSKKLNDILKKVNKSTGSPVINFLISSEFVDSLKNDNQFDLYSRSDYKLLMNTMPIMSIAVLNQETSIIELFWDREKPNFEEYRTDDYFRDVAQYEKELQSVIKYNKYA